MRTYLSCSLLLFCCYTSRAVKQQQHYGIFCFSNGVIHRRQSKDFRKGGRLACFCFWIFLRALRDTGCRRPECVCCWQLLYEVEISFVVFLTEGCGMNKRCIAKSSLDFLLLRFFYADLSWMKIRYLNALVHPDEVILVTEGLRDLDWLAHSFAHACLSRVWRSLKAKYDIKCSIDQGTLLALFDQLTTFFSCSDFTI
jgi:hypothetical protein